MSQPILPNQPITENCDRFIENKAVAFILDKNQQGKAVSLNQVSMFCQTRGFSEDLAQFYQLIGYPISNWKFLTCVTEEKYLTVQKMIEQKQFTDQKDKMIEAYRDKLNSVQVKLEHAVVALFQLNKNEDDPVNEPSLEELKIMMHNGLAELYDCHPDDLKNGELEELLK